MHTSLKWKQAAAALGLSLLMFSPAVAQTVGARQAPDREAKQARPAQSSPSNTDRPAARADQAAQPGTATRPGTAARNPAQPAQPRTANKPVNEDSALSADHQIAALLAICNQEEIALAKLGMEQAQNEDVKQFAQMLIEDHTRVLQQLRKVAPQAVEQAGLGERGDNLAKSADSPRTERTASRNTGFDPVEVHKQIAQRCIESSRKELGEKQGAEADMCFIGQQLVLHQQMIDKQHVFAEYASPELRQAIEESTQGTEKHLQEAKQLVKQLAPQAAGEVREKRTGAADTDAPLRENRNKAGSTQEEGRAEKRPATGAKR